MHAKAKLAAVAAVTALLALPAAAQQTEVIIVEPPPAGAPAGAITGPGSGDGAVLPPSPTGRGEIQGPDQTGGWSPDYVRGVSPPGSVDTQGTGAGPSGFSNSGQ